MKSLSVKRTVYNILRGIVFICLFLFLLNLFVDMNLGDLGYISSETKMYSDRAMENETESLEPGDTVAVLSYDFDSGLARVRYPEDPAGLFQGSKVGFVSMDHCFEYKLPENLNYEADDFIVLTVLPGTTFEEFVNEFASQTQEHYVAGVYVDDYPSNTDALEVSYFCEALSIPYGSFIRYTKDSCESYIEHRHTKNVYDESFKILPQAFDLTLASNNPQTNELNELDDCIFYTNNHEMQNSWIKIHSSDRNSIIFNSHPLVEYDSTGKFTYSYLKGELLDTIIGMRNSRCSEED